MALYQLRQGETYNPAYTEFMKKNPSGLWQGEIAWGGPVEQNFSNVGPGAPPPPGSKNTNYNPSPRSSVGANASSGANTSSAGDSSLPSAPQYNAPEWNEGEISSLTQSRASTGLRELRRQMQKAQGQAYDSPQERRMTLRDALQGYGSGLNQVMSGAGQIARSEYGQKFGQSVDAAKTKFQSLYDEWRLKRDSAEREKDRVFQAKESAKNRTYQDSVRTEDRKYRTEEREKERIAPEPPTAQYPGYSPTPFKFEYPGWTPLGRA